VDDVIINWTVDDLKKLKKEKTLFKTEGEYEIFGIYYDSQNVDYYALISAQDKYGKRKLQFLSVVLTISFLIATSIIWLVSFNFTKQLILPLDNFQKKITNISSNNLTERLAETGKEDEINLIAKAFNQMMRRIEDSYKNKQEFTANASHELRTPIARIITQLENLEQLEKHSAETLTYLQNIKTDANNMAELISSLLTLSKISETQIDFTNNKKRIDEIIFDSMALVKKNYPDFSSGFELIENNEFEYDLDIFCNESLLKIAFSNLIKNAYLYSANKKALIEIEQISTNQIAVSIKNNGNTIEKSEQHKLYDTFMRGKNSQNKPGSGLGLPLSKRIFNYHNATLNYSVTGQNLNQFEIIFSI
jgi:signal transduction histidine kinase